MLHRRCVRSMTLRATAGRVSLQLAAPLPGAARLAFAPRCFLFASFPALDSVPFHGKLDSSPPSKDTDDTAESATFPRPMAYLFPRL